MSYPSNRGNEFNNITQEKLDSMSTAELLELLESINETMTEDNFDDELITACLDALDRKSPMPEYPSTERAWRSFEDKVELDKRASGGDSGTTANRPKRRAKRTLRTILVAAIIVFCLFSCMLVAQAAGVEFGGNGYTLTVMAVSWFAMALNGAGWLLVSGTVTPALEKLRGKLSGGDAKWLAVLSGACSLGIFGYLNANEIKKGLGSTIACLAGALSMVAIMKLIVPKHPKLA